MSSFGSMSTGSKFGIIFGGLIGLIFIAGFVKLCFNKRKLKKDAKKAAQETAGKTDQEKLVGKQVGQGDLFGVRASERGHFGGFSQSRSNSPTPSYVLSPGTTLVDWSKSGQSRSHSASSSVSSLARSLAPPTNPSQSKRKPSPLGLQPSSAELKGRTNHDPSNVGGIGGSYMPPLPSSRSVRSHRSASPTNSTFDKDELPSWVSPLDVHFSRPSTPKSRPASYLPKLQFPDEIEKTGLFVPTPSNSVREIKSEAASIVSSDASTAPPLPTVKSPAFSIFPPSTYQVPSPAAGGSSRSILSASDERERPPPRRSPKDAKFIPQPVPLSDLTPQITTIDPNSFPQDTRQWNPSSPVNDSVTKHQWDPSSPTFPGPIYCNDGRHPPSTPIIRDSIVSKQRVSIFQPSHTHDASADGLNQHTRTHSIAGSSMYSTRTSVLGDNKDSSQSQPQYSHTRSRSTSQPRPSNRSRSASNSAHKRSTSSHSLARTQDSLRRHSRKPSSSYSPRDSKRHSRDRDVLHYDPTPTHRTRAGSVQGRRVDFDHPRESPFSNANAIRHSPNSSISSSSSRGRNGSVDEDEAPPMPSLPNKPPQLELPELSRGRGRSESEVSQVSVSDFYDAYYRQSILGQRASAMSTVDARGSRLINGSGGVSGGVGGNGVVVGARRPAALKLGETIVEVVTPTPSPMVVRGVERFPSMI